MWVHFERLLAREPELQDPGNPDALRRYRVATRRLRAALRLFVEAYPEDDVGRLRKGLADAARLVGAVRDLDVRIASVEGWALGEGRSPAVVSPLAGRWRHERAEAAERMGRWLGSRRHRRSIDALSTFVADDSAGPAAGGEPVRTVRDWVTSRIWADYEHLRSFEPVIGTGDRPTLHRIRILGKRLRYGLEFLGDVLGPDQPMLVSRLVALQDQLGELNDAALMAAAVRAFLETDRAALGPDEAVAIDAYLAERERAAILLREAVPWVWRPLVVAPFARRLNRTIMVSPRR